MANEESRRPIAATRCCRSLSSWKISSACSPRLVSKRRLELSAKNLSKPRHTGLVGHIEPQRRHRDAIMGERRKIGAVGWRRPVAAHEADPVIGVAAAVVTRLDTQEFLVALTLAGDRDARHVVRSAVGKVYVDEHIVR